MSQTYYRMQMKAGSEGKRIAEEMLNQGRITADIDYAGNGFDQLKFNDIILIHKGAYPIALIKVINKIEEVDNSEESFGIDYKIDILSYFDKLTDFEKTELSLWGNCPPTGTFFPIYAGNETYNRINRWYTMILHKIDMQEKIKILEYKKQIILQGPPGTGKTRMAELIAKEMTKESIESPTGQINEYFKNNSHPSNEIIEKRNKLETELSLFQHEFDKQQIANLTLDRYAFGKGDNNTFCWWIEYGLYNLGGYTGDAGKFKIYWKKATNSYKKIGFLKNVEDDDEAMTLLAQQLENVVNENNLLDASKKLSNGFILKILHSYYPDKYFPINNEKCINNALKLLGVSFSELNIFEKNTKLQNVFKEKKKEYNADIKNYEFMNFLFKTFEMKGNISLQEDELVKKGEYKLIQFHPAYTYEDFVRGIVVETNEHNQPEYKVINKVLAEFAQKALENSSTNYVLIIDEINRANLPAVLGELIYALEYRFDQNNPNNTTVESIYALKMSEDDEDGNRELKLPTNLYIIGTMNSADRSVGHIDYAIRRRFAYIDILPEIEPVNDSAKLLFKTVCELFVKDFDNINWNHPKFIPSDYIAADFRPEDVMLGHSYFITKKENESEKNFGEAEQIKMKLKYEVIPILKEYLKDGILNESARAKVENLC